MRREMYLPVASLEHPFYATTAADRLTVAGGVRRRVAGRFQPTVLMALGLHDMHPDGSLPVPIEPPRLTRGSRRS